MFLFRSQSFPKYYKQKVTCPAQLMKIERWQEVNFLQTFKMNCWTRIAFLNMSDLSQSCPSPWTETVSGYPSSTKRVCYRSENSVDSCDSVVYSNTGGEYNQVCGRVIGYHFFNTHEFIPYNNYQYSIDSYYVDGLSVTHGQPPRMHIWTFAVGHSEI